MDQTFAIIVFNKSQSPIEQRLLQPMEGDEHRPIVQVWSCLWRKRAGHDDRCIVIAQGLSFLGLSHASRQCREGDLF